ncbi:AmmeMemoRadiSam system protein B [Bradyrhizobium erythrophlei]|uniref:Poly-gamma-glutamate synthesis protein (Capsule biosynthesis protein) n=1 Tax=Bradyrhizobium erythrophlei TaxID=1437360 RepID=A0A1M5Y7D5_9BRAD|nr:AmmeMemoRadiSam system protein B [Bradyrhizobium erythrophlei]SHI08005.1 poly-gamma-glutamate synthesis protein (capsule biosynthesis protein) [Bradyrhizobium erythrophlei]
MLDIMRAYVPIAFKVVMIVMSLLCWGRAQAQLFESLYTDSEIFLDAIQKEKISPPVGVEIHGITVPHHLVAADLIARGFWVASGNEYDRIIVLSPDHFRGGHRLLATTARSFNTVLGQINTDVSAAELLLKSELVESSDLFEREHGIAAILPFIRYFFRDTPVLAVTISTSSSEAEWRAAVEALSKVVTKRTLIVQSTDFSHYLPAHVAASRDQETLNVIAEGDPARISELHQSNHLDSKAAQFAQMSLQRSLFDSYPTVIANRNQAEYGSRITATTSYFVEVYTRNDSPAFLPAYDDQQVFYFGGDVFPGRWLTRPLEKSENRSKLIEMVQSLTGGRPLIVNLEGALLPEGLSISKPDLHAIDRAIAAPILRGLNVVVAGLANNHSFDFGPNGLKETTSELRRLGIQSAQHMSVVDLGAFRMVAINFIRGRTVAGYPFAGINDIQQLCRRPTSPPLIAFVHWGEEYTSGLPSDLMRISEALHDCGVSLIIGAHSHQASAHPVSVHAGQIQVVFSLGNLLFDQRSSLTSGAILELRIFKQRTMATRMRRVLNFFNELDPSGSIAAQ